MSENISLHQTSPENIVNQVVTVQSEFHQYSKMAKKNWSSKTEACGVIELCDTNCQKFITLSGAEM